MILAGENDVDCSEGHLTQCHFVLHKFHIVSLGVGHGLPRREASDVFILSCLHLVEILKSFPRQVPQLLILLSFCNEERYA